jgi:hypothetical protein
MRKGHWVYIPAQDEGGFQGKQVGDHLLGGAAAQALTGLVNNDVIDGRIKQDAPSAQLYNLESDPFQARNVFSEQPEIVTELETMLQFYRKQIPDSARLGWINLKQN